MEDVKVHGAGRRAGTTPMLATTTGVVLATHPCGRVVFTGCQRPHRLVA